MPDVQKPEGEHPTKRLGDAERASGVRRVDSASLLGSARELVIEHAGREYRLRVTQNGKLILTA
jgi:hemin uptake protein HemP